MQDILNSIKVTLNERITSPLGGTFFLAFLTINYKMIAVLFSDLDVLEAIKYIDETLYGEKWSKTKYLLAYPALATVGYLLFFPWLSRWAMAYETGQAEKTKEKRRELLSLQVLDKEEQAKLLQLHDQIEDRYSKELAEKRKQIFDLESALKDANASKRELDDTISSMQKQLDNSVASRKDREVQISQLKHDLETVKQGYNNVQALAEQLKTELDDSERLRTELQTKIDNLTDNPNNQSLSHGVLYDPTAELERKKRKRAAALTKARSIGDIAAGLLDVSPKTEETSYDIGKLPSSHTEKDS